MSRRFPMFTPLCLLPQPRPINWAICAPIRNRCGAVSICWHSECRGDAEPGSATSPRWQRHPRCPGGFRNPRLSCRGTTSFESISLQRGVMQTIGSALGDELSVTDRAVSSTICSIRARCVADGLPPVCATSLPATPSSLATLQDGNCDRQNDSEFPSGGCAVQEGHRPEWWYGLCRRRDILSESASGLERNGVNHHTGTDRA